MVSLNGKEKMINASHNPRIIRIYSFFYNFQVKLTYTNKHIYAFIRLKRFVIQDLNTNGENSIFFCSRSIYCLSIL